ncbi:MAG: hypothetical protein F6J93_00345 [Oscillatoria sp. SIO1A7]|nr:hypothetical protein [Oscillatoria sp. SIO1A7]
MAFALKLSAVGANSQCPMPPTPNPSQEGTAQCPMPNAQCPMPNAQRPMINYTML